MTYKLYLIPKNGNWFPDEPEFPRFKFAGRSNFYDAIEYWCEENVLLLEPIYLDTVEQCWAAVLNFKSQEDYNLFKLVFGHEYNIMDREEYLNSKIF